MNEQAWATAVINYCCANAVTHFFVAPGSRCTPLTLAIARHRGVQLVQHFDERGLAFAALGYGKSAGVPGVFVCTSGTAVANAYPAVIEASAESVPLLLFTADRPDELRGTGANQTINQNEIFGNYPQLFLNMPVPEDLSDTNNHDAGNFLYSALQKCFAAAELGPVHVNWKFREPFMISEYDEVTPVENQTICVDNQSKYGTSIDDDSQSLPIQIRGDVVVAVGSCSPQEAEQAKILAADLNAPVLSDITSGLRMGCFELPIDFDLPRPDTVLQLGGRIVSKAWLQWTEQLSRTGTEFIHLTSSGKTFNPNSLQQKKYRTPLLNLRSKVGDSRNSDSFSGPWRRAASLRDEVIQRLLEATNQLSEPAVAHFLYKTSPDSSALFIGNSMPIRDMDWFATDEKGRVKNVFANRGASGIDGLLATATGIATGLQQLVTVVLGDLSALHDLNSLALIANSSQPVIVVVINNQRGHIFDLLPIRNSIHFERFFATPHRIQFEFGAKMFGLPFQQVGDMADFRSSYQEAVAGRQSTVLELTTDHQVNLNVRKQVKQEVLRCGNQS